MFLLSLHNENLIILRLLRLHPTPAVMSFAISVLLLLSFAAVAEAQTSCSELEVAAKSLLVTGLLDQDGQSCEDERVQCSKNDSCSPCIYETGVFSAVDCFDGCKYCFPDDDGKTELCVERTYSSISNFSPYERRVYNSWIGNYTFVSDGPENGVSFQLQINEFSGGSSSFNDVGCSVQFCGDGFAQLSIDCSQIAGGAVLDYCKNPVTGVISKDGTQLSLLEKLVSIPSLVCSAANRMPILGSNGDANPSPTVGIGVPTMTESLSSDGGGNYSVSLLGSLLAAIFFCFT